MIENCFLIADSLVKRVSKFDALSSIFTNFIDIYLSFSCDNIDALKDSIKFMEQFSSTSLGVDRLSTS